LSRAHKSNDRSNVQGFDGFGTRFILKVDRNKKHGQQAPEGIGAMIGAMSKGLKVSVKDLY
jgi:hypothetical protein